LLHSRGKTDLAKYNDKFIRTCINGRLDDAKWLYSICVDISYKNNCAILFACQNGYLDMAKWLYSVGAEITEPDNEPFLATCLGDAVNVIEWLIDIHYKYGGYIEFEQYGLYKDKIKNVLIDNNLVNPSTLSREDLTYYLARTDNFVPPDFTTQHEGFTVKYRGKHTKPAYRE
jgi:hypothetical protein